MAGVSLTSYGRGYLLGIVKAGTILDVLVIIFSPEIRRAELSSEPARVSTIVMSSRSG